MEKVRPWCGQPSDRGRLRNRCQISRRSVNPLLRYRDFCDFKDGGRRHFGFSKIRNFNSPSTVRGQYPPLYQISSKSVKRLQRYGDLTFFSKMAAVRHLGFLGHLLGPPTTTTWWSLSFCQIWLVSIT